MAKKKPAKNTSAKKRTADKAIEKAVERGVKKALTGKAFEKAVEKAVKKVTTDRMRSTTSGRFVTYRAGKKVAKKASGRARGSTFCGTGPGR